MVDLLNSPGAIRFFRIVFVTAAIFAVVMALLPKPPEMPGEPGDKIQHMIAFFTLAVLAAAGWRDRRYWQLFAGLALLGAAIELLQAIPFLHRDSDVLDWLADMAATAVALGLIRLVIFRGRLGSPRARNGSDA